MNKSDQKFICKHLSWCATVTLSSPDCFFLCTSTDISTTITLYMSIVCSLIRRTGIDGASDDSAERVPRTIIEPVVKLVKSLLSQETSGAVIEIPEFRGKERHNQSINDAWETSSYLRSSICVCVETYGSNSWMTLSNLNTEKRRVEKAAQRETDRERGVKTWSGCGINKQ